MRFENLLLEMLLEGKIEDTLARHHTIPEHIKQDYLRQIPANNAQHLDWILQQHSKGNIRPEHNINDILSNFNKLKDKLSKKQIHQYKSVDELHTSILPHIDSIQKSKKEKQEEGTETLYSSPTMTVKQHNSYESCVKAGVLPKNNTSGLDKAKWCISVGDYGGSAHHDYYTESGFHPVYTIEHHHPDGTSSKHMFVYNYHKSQNEQELRNEDDYRPGFSDVTSTRHDLLDHYSRKHPEILKTPISKFFSEEGRKEYKKAVEPVYNNLQSIKQKIPISMSNEEYLHYYNQGLKEKQGSIHNELAQKNLTEYQLNHLLSHGNSSSKSYISKRNDLKEEHMQQLANTSDMIVHHNLLQKNISEQTYNKIVQKSHPQLAYDVIEHKLFNKSHIDMMLQKKLPSYDHLLIRHSDLLEPHHINKIIDNDESGYSTDFLLKRFYNSKKITNEHIDKILDKHMHLYNSIIDYNGKQLQPNHIDKLIESSNSDVTNKLLSSGIKLEPHHIDKIISKNDNSIKTLISTNGGNFNETQIDNIIKNNITPEHNNEAGIIVLMSKLRNKLSDENIDDLLKVKSYHEAVSVFLKHHIKDHHISKLIDDDNTGEISASLINSVPLNNHHIDQIISKNRPNLNKLLLDHHQSVLEPHHIKQLLPTNNDINTAMNNDDLDYFKNASVIKGMHLNDIDTVLKKAVHHNRTDVINEILSNRDEPDVLDKLLVHHFSHPRNIDKLKSQVSILDDDMKNSIYHTTEDERIKKLVRG